MISKKRAICIECGVPVWKGTIKCRTCFSKTKRGDNYEINIIKASKVISTGRKNNKRTAVFCIDCNVSIDFYSKRCKSCANKGSLNQFYGKSHTDSTSNIISLANKGRWAGTNNPRYTKPLKKEDNPNWKGGVTPLREIIRKCTKSKKWVRDILERDKFTCTICGDRNGYGKTVYLNADHFPLSFSEILENYNIQNIDEALACDILWSLDNGRTLCESCHRETPNYGGKGTRLKFERLKKKI